MEMEMEMAESEQAVNVVAPVSEVTLLEDRARVVRAGRITLGAGTHRLRVEDVAPVLSDKTLSVDLEGARVVDARVHRRAVVRQRGDADADADEASTERAKLEHELECLDEEIARRDGEKGLLVERGKALELVATSSLEDLATDASWGLAAGEDWTAKLAELTRREREQRREAAEAGLEIDELRRTRDRLEGRLHALDRPSERLAAAIEIDIEVGTQEAGAPVEVSFRIGYVVPCACWRPYHRARLEDGKVHFSTDACVWQNTGEDWADARLLFSTERASLGAEPPDLSDDRLAVKPKRDEVVVEARESTITTAGLGAGAPKSREVMGIDDGGESLALRAATVSTVPSDGRPYRIPIDGASFEADVELTRIAFPELGPAVHWRTVQANRANGPILAGPVDLVRDFGVVGRGSVLFIAAGERFELGWGPDAELRVSRDEEKKETSRKLSQWESREHHIEVRLSNLGATPKQVEVKERVPVSEVDKVAIAHDTKHTTGGHEPDRDGFVVWNVALDPFGHETLELRYTMKWRHGVVGA